MFPRKRRISKKELEEQTKYTEEILQPEIQAIQGELKKEKREMVELSPDISIRLPEVEDLEVEEEKNEKSCSLHLSKIGKSLEIWVDLNTPEVVNVGDRAYLMREDKLIELADFSIWDIGYKAAPEGERVQLERGEEGEVVVDLRKLKKNQKLNGFLEK